MFLPAVLDKCLLDWVTLIGGVRTDASNRVFVAMAVKITRPGPRMRKNASFCHDEAAVMITASRVDIRKIRYRLQHRARNLYPSQPTMSHYYTKESI